MSFLNFWVWGGCRPLVCSSVADNCSGNEALDEDITKRIEVLEKKTEEKHDKNLPHCGIFEARFEFYKLQNNI